MIRLRFGWGGAAALVVGFALGVAGCSCDPPPDETSLEITSPANGASLSLGSDTDSVQPGVQIDVTALAMGLSVGEDIRVEVDGVPAGGSTVPSDGIVTISGVTIDSGTHTLRATARSGGIVSDDVTVTVTDSCFAVAFVSPEAGDRLGGGDDTDGDACGATFETTVVATAAAPDGAEARILVNGSSRRTGTVQSGQVRFTGVGLDNRNGNANSLEVEVTADGVTCSASLPSGVFVDCEGASCTISAPVTDTPFLNTDNDTSAAEGFQGDFAVTTDASGANQDIRLIIDGDESGAASATPSGMVAAFDGVELTEGTHRFVAECRDDAGNVTRSGPAEWTVDITPCGVSLDNPLTDSIFVDSDDLDLDPTNGIQILSDGTAGSDCEGLRVGLCSGIDALPFMASSATWTEEITLASVAMQDLCAQTQDPAGNVSQAMVGVRVNTEAPQLEIASPADNTGFNVAGTMGRTADLTNGNTTCEAAFEVFCSIVDSDVELVLSDSDTTIATSNCDADVGVPAPYSGRASFPSAALPSVQDGSAFGIVARQSSDRLEGESAPISVTSDCVAPELMVLRPVCGSVLLPATQDENPGTPAFEYRTTITRVGDPMLPVTLSITSAGGAEVYGATDSTSGSNANFPDADYSAGGTLTVAATGTDSAGNIGTTPSCTVTVEDLPEVIINSPVMDQVLSSADDCSASGGTQIAVTGSTDAAPGSAIAVTVGGAPPVAGTVGALGAIDMCVDVVDGRAVTIRVDVTDTRGTGTGSVVVVIDTMPPVLALNPTLSIEDRRAGIARFMWTAVEDADGSRLSSYELRCATSPISTEGEWAAARSVPLTTIPGAGGAMESEDVDAFRTGLIEHCVLRGIDPTGAMTPLHPSLIVDAPFLTESRVGPDARFGQDVAGVGDVNGDGLDDVLVGGNGSAYVYFGNPSDPPTFSAQPDAGFSNSADPFFGFSVAGLGDVNGDSMPDFAIGSPGIGAVYIFFGNAAGDPLPAVCNVGAAGCSADVTINAASFFGLDVQSAGDFDGDGSLDVAIGNSAVGAGEVIVALGPFTAASEFDIPAGANAEPNGFRIVAPAGIQNSFGNAVGTAGGDATGDGRHDILIGAPANAGSSANYFAAGAMYTGSGLIAYPAAGLLLLESAANASNGLDVSGIGDVDGDSFLDVATAGGVPGAQGRLNIFRGNGMTYSSASGSYFQITNDTATNGDRFGLPIGIGRHPSSLLGNLGDLDRDGRTDICVGSESNGGGDGSMHLFYSDPVLADRLRSEGIEFPAAAGAGDRRVAYAGDLNGDGFNDIAVTEPASADLHILY